jgi:hypothetical protein
VLVLLAVAAGRGPFERAALALVAVLLAAVELPAVVLALVHAAVARPALVLALPAAVRSSADCCWCWRPSSGLRSRWYGARRAVRAGQVVGELPLTLALVAVLALVHAAVALPALVLALPAAVRSSAGCRSRWCTWPCWRPWCP